MKKKLNIFCVVMFIILAAEACSLLGVFFHGVINGYTAAMNEPQQKEILSKETISLSVLPVDMSHDNSFKATDKVTGKTYEVWPIHLMMIDDFERGIAARTINVLAGLALVAAGIASIVIFIRFIIGINRDEVFTFKTVRRLRFMGWMFLIMCIGQFADNIVDANVVSAHFMQSGYMVNYTDFIPFDALIFAVFVFIIAEVFTIGIRMKEEQDLTV